MTYEVVWSREEPFGRRTEIRVTRHANGVPSNVEAVEIGPRGAEQHLYPGPPHITRSKISRERELQDMIWLALQDEGL